MNLKLKHRSAAPDGREAQRPSGTLSRRHLAVATTAMATGPRHMNSYRLKAATKFHIDPDLVRSFEIDYGRRLMWVALECMGKPLDDFVAARRRNGW